LLLLLAAAAIHLATAFFRLEGMHFRSLFLKAIMPGVMHTANLSSSTLLLNSSHEQQDVNTMPRYAEHFVGTAALLGAFGLVFGAMALGAWWTPHCACFFLSTARLQKQLTVLRRGLVIVPNYLNTV